MELEYIFSLHVLVEGLSSNRGNFLIFMASMVILSGLIRLLLELLQFAALKIYYLLSWVNWIEIILFPCAIGFVLVFKTDCLCPSGLQWQIGCIAVFLTWIDLIIFFEKLPLAGKLYVTGH
jgi:hypothetical protein